MAGDGWGMIFLNTATGARVVMKVRLDSACGKDLLATLNLQLSIQNLMKLKQLILSTVALASLGLASCTTEPAPHTKTGAVGGGLLGAGLGAIVGHQSGRALEGAAIGGAAGAAGGALLGSAADDRERQRQRQYHHQAPPPRRHDHGYYGPRY